MENTPGAPLRGEKRVGIAQIDSDVVLLGSHEYRHSVARTGYRMLDSKAHYKSFGDRHNGPVPPGSGPQPGGRGTEGPLMSMPIVDDAAKVLADPTAYADEATLHAALTGLRANTPVSLVEVPGYKPFWAITKHADVVGDRTGQPVCSPTGPGPVADDRRRRTRSQAGVGGRASRTLIHMDDPQHRVVRAIGGGLVQPESHGE